ncbi:type II toxin-antitoxin system RelE/ParE family toxin [Desulfobulbus sp. US4]|nr:type II toxin-antitoxin system RelE/ParE family toxin [Desulfobulbus sp. US4]
MDIYFKRKKLQKICSEKKIAVKELGAKRAQKLMQRMMELSAAESLSDISIYPPARCHELSGDRKGQLSVDLGHPYRLLFIPADDQVLKKKDGGLDKTAISSIEIIEIADTH